ncbi:MAG TPA: TetR/AcrR family transcriptional regulator [Acidimicrobiales bacterium]|jgi:AcrR family transcriptional regulator
MSTHRQRERAPRSERNHEPDRLQRRAARREELIAAALRAIRRDGPGVSMEAIAAEAGCSKPIVYRHFGDREGLTEALGDLFAGELVNALDRALTQDLPPEELLHATIDTYLEFVERDPNLYRFLIGRLADPKSTVETHGLVARVAQRVAVVLGEQMRALGLDSGPAEPWAFGIVGMVHLAGDWWLDRRTMTRERLVTYLTTLLWGGLGTAAAATTAAEATTITAEATAPSGKDAS